MFLNTPRVRMESDESGKWNLIESDPGRLYLLPFLLLLGVFCEMIKKLGVKNVKVVVGGACGVVGLIALLIRKCILWKNTNY